MPKKVDVKELQGIRLARKVKLRKYSPAVVYLQVLGSGAIGAPRSLYVYTEQARFLFNCGEGSQRLAYEHKVKLGMMEHILITHKSWSNVGGLPGILLTLQDTGVPEINLHGPAGIESLYEGTRHFIRFRDLNIKYRHYSENDGVIGDSNDPLTITCVPFWAKEESNGNSSEKDPLEDDVDEVEDLFAHENRWLKKKPRMGIDDLSLEERKQKLKESRKCKNLAVAYICRPPPKAGTLLIDKCVKAGVPQGPLLGNLKRGEDVTLPSGKVVLASEVTAPDDPGPVFIVVEAPSEAYLDSLIHCQAFSKYQASATCDEDLADVVVHFTPSHVMRDPRYVEWMSRFSPSTCHLFINENNLCMGSEAVHRIQYKLNLLSEHFFPLLKDQSIPYRKEDALNKCSNDEGGSNNHNGINGKCIQEENSTVFQQAIVDNSGNLTLNSDQVIGSVHQATTLMTYHIRPRKKLDRSSELSLSPQTYKDECFSMENFESVLKDAKSKILDSAGNVNRSDNYPNIIFLGTGSCIPNKTRNTSGILLNLSSDKTMIMDCGEGTYGQLVRFYGLTESEKVMQQLVAIYVSHLHADHHIGFIRLLLARRKAFEKARVQDVPKLLLLAPPKIIAYLHSYHKNFEPVLDDFTLVGNQKFLSPEFKMSETYTDIQEKLDMKSIDMTYVIHCHSSFGVAWTHKDGWKMAYSGDTMPCEDFVRIGQNCDLLIHEATMEDELEEDARIKTHSTTSQAIKVGCDMNARHILLTHFSQRYAKVPFLESEVPENVGIAFDNMKVCLHNLPKLRHMYEALVTMFAEDYDEMKEKTAKKRAARENLKALEEGLVSKNDRDNSNVIKRDVTESISKKQKVDVL